MLNSKSGHAGLRSSGDSLLPPEFNCRIAARVIRLPSGYRPHCIWTTAASRAFTLGTNMSDHNQSRRRSKVVGFVIAELVAIGILLLVAAFVVVTRPIDPAVITALNVVMLAAAGGAATMPIFFFAFAPILPRSGR